MGCSCQCFIDVKSCFPSDIARIVYDYVHINLTTFISNGMPWIFQSDRNKVHVSWDNCKRTSGILKNESYSEVYQWENCKIELTDNTPSSISYGHPFVFDDRWTTTFIKWNYIRDLLSIRQLIQGRIDTNQANELDPTCEYMSDCLRFAQETIHEQFGFHQYLTHK